MVRNEAETRFSCLVTNKFDFEMSYVSLESYDKNTYKKLTPKRVEHTCSLQRYQKSHISFRAIKIARKKNVEYYLFDSYIGRKS